MESELRIEIQHAIHFCVRLGESPPSTFAKLVSVLVAQPASTGTEDSVLGEGPHPTMPEVDDLRHHPPQRRSKDVKSFWSKTGVKLWMISPKHWTFQLVALNSILVDHLGMRRVCARWVPRLLTEDQQATRVQICGNLLKRLNREGEAFLDKIIMVDESWIHHYEPETKFLEAP